MIDKDLLCKLLEKYENDGQTRGYFLIFRLVKTIVRLRKTAKKGKLISGENEKVNEWFYDNFSRLEEKMLCEFSKIRHMGRVQKSGNVPRFFSVLCGYVEETVPENKDDVMEIFSYLNNCEDTLNLIDSKSLEYFFEAATCFNICRVFLSCKDGNDNENVQIKIEKLFNLLDVLSSLDENAPLFSNPVEKMLMSERSGVYQNLSQATKQSYRKNLIKIAKSRGQSQYDAAKRIVEDCDEKCHIGKVLCDKAYGGRQYINLLLLLTAVFTLSLCIVSPIFVVACIPVYYVSDIILSRFFRRFVICDFHLPRLELDKVPKNKGVMTVITTLLLGGKSDEAVFESLKKCYFSNGGENVYFALLCDLCDSDEKMSDKDVEIIEKARDRILEMRKRYGNVFYLFVRDRQYNKGEEKYIAKERKRGAVCALSSFLCENEDLFCDGSIKPDVNTCKNIKYILTLDADTNLEFDCIKELVGIMCHPQNEPYYDKEKHVVTRGYGMLQPSSSTTIDSAYSTFFTKVMCGYGGVDNYNGGGSDENMSLFGKSFFCGKGMIEKNVFYDAFCTEDAPVNNSILSHDSVEGAVLRCGFVPEITFTDSYPKEELSYYKRLHRWTRGDIQNIPFLLSKRKTVKGKKIENNIGAFSKFMIFKNVINALACVFSFLLLFLSCALDKNEQILAFTIALSTLFLPFVDTILSLPKLSLWQNFRRLFYSRHIFSGLWIAFLQTLFSLSALPKTALVKTDAIIRSSYRSLVSKKHRLEWTTAAQNDAEKNDGLLGYIKKNIICAFSGTALYLLTDNGVLKILSLLWLFMPVLAYRFSKTNDKKNVMDEENIRTLKKYCFDMWSFFDENVHEKTNHLPTDNIGINDKLCHITSPTNIGLYLVCIFAAREIGLLSTKEMEYRLVKTLDAIEKLPKYKGILYNWYNIFDLSVEGDGYLSSVDMGNFLACVITAMGACDEFEDEMKNPSQIKNRLKELLNCDISVLYDNLRHLFYIGAKNDKGKLTLDRNRYDMLMSEARILSFVSVSKKWVDKEHLRHLSRRLVEGRGYVGLSSWSGTAFEFFMPELFVKSKEGSLCHEALSFSYNAAKESAVVTEKGRVFGISESCYNVIDECGNYKYFAFGTSKTALKNFDEKRIISPYSSFLFLGMDLSRVLENLNTLKELGAYGRYGFYESVDFENHERDEDFGIVKSFMSHHIGMSMLGAVNEIYDGIVRKWFCRDEDIFSALELWEEKIPFDTRVKKISRKKYLLKEEFSKVADIQDEVNQTEAIGQKCDKKLICGEKLASYVEADSLGFSFVFDEENTLSEKEKLCFDDGFDLCSNANAFVIDRGIARFDGEYQKKKYKANTFIPQNITAKITQVNSSCSCSMQFQIPSKFYDCQIGAGIGFFKAKNKDMIGFCFGFEIVSGTEIIGADYKIENKQVKVFFEDDFSDKRVFCIGYAADVEGALNCYEDVRQNLEKIKQDTIEFNESLTVKQGDMPKTLRELLNRYFALQDCHTANRRFVNNSLYDKAYFCLLSIYCDYGCRDSDVIALFKNPCKTPVENFFVCLGFCTYVLKTHNTKIPDVNVDGKSIYRHCLESLFKGLNMAKSDEEYYHLARYTLKTFAETCTFLSDTRMSQKLCDMAEELDK